MATRALKNILITGGAGFIGSHFIRMYLNNTSFTGSIINLDSCTYAADQNALDEFEAYANYQFVKGDICDRELVETLFKNYQIDTVVHFAAESHVDRSITGPGAFITTNINGTFTLLEAAKNAWVDREDVLYHHISTDEVFGSLGPEGFFSEDTAYDPRSPYSASKASSDHLVRAYYHTYNLPITISNCSNNYGPFQNPEKLIPHMITKMLADEPLPVYGDGKNIRDWLYVKDHISAIMAILTSGKSGETYTIGGENEWTNIELVSRLCELVAQAQDIDNESYKKLITSVEDRAGHDRRYAIDCSKIKRELGWAQSVSFEEGLVATVQWYLQQRF